MSFTLYLQIVCLFVINTGSGLT